MWARGFSVRIGGAVFAGHAAAVPATRVTAAAAAAGCQRGGARRYKGASHSRPPPGRGAEARGLQTSDGEPLLNVVFVNPQIAQNLGSFGRTSIGLGAKVHVVKPMNFSLSDKHVKRSGLDYWPHVDLVVHENWGDFAEASAGGTHFYFTRAADVSALDVDYTAAAAATAALAPCAENRGSGTEKVYLLFGAETTGFTPEAEAASRAGGVRVALPLIDPEVIRCFNVASSATMALWDAFRQLTHHYRSLPKTP